MRCPGQSERLKHVTMGCHPGPTLILGGPTFGEQVKQELGAKIDHLATRTEGRFTLLNWMLGATITLLVGVLLRLFLVKPV